MEEVQMCILSEKKVCNMATVPPTIDQAPTTSEEARAQEV